VRSLRVKVTKAGERRRSFAAITKGLPPPPSELTQAEFSWLLQTKGGVALVWRIQKAKALHGLPWVQHMVAYYKPAALKLLDDPPARLSHYASHWRRMIDPQ
jgi:hypothetical protein